MRSGVCATCAGILLTTAAVSHGSGQSDDQLGERFREEVAVLAADAMEGRGLGTEGLARAADWLEARAREAGLEPGFEGSYRQMLPVKTGVSLLPGNRLEGVAAADWTPLGASSSGAFDGPLVFAGYGIEAPEVGYRELEGLDLAGRVVLMLRYEPQERDDASPFAGRSPSRWSSLRYKVLQARERGAAAVIFAAGPLQDEGLDKVPALRNDGPESSAGVPVLQVKRSVAERWLATAGIDLRAFQETVDRDLVPRSRELADVRVRGEVALEAVFEQVANLVGVLPGRGELADEHVVVGAHYDHLGFGGSGSMRPDVHEIHNGADDNASGSVALLGIARDLSARLKDVESHRAVVFAWFAAEEVGLGGSSHFVRHPPLPVERCAAMLNLDMVGRLRDGKLVALGSESASEWPDRIAAAAAQVPGLEVAHRGDGYGPSDHTSFYSSGVPVLYLFTGAHDEYHTPADDAATLNADGAVSVMRFATALAGGLAASESRPTWVRASSGSAFSGDARGYGAWLGSVPDYTAMEAAEGGVLLSDVRPDSPAERASIRGGDRIVGMAGTRIANLYDMTYVLQDHRPGQTIDVVVEREGVRLTLRATLGERPGRGEAGPAAPAAPPPAPGPAAADPHAAAPEDSRAAAGLDPFFEGRPGADFVVGAGSPFEDRYEGETHLADVRQLTFEGENAEGYFSPDGRRLIYQSTKTGGCDQEYVLDLASGAERLVSTGRGRTTCGYFDWPEADRIVYSSTHAASDACPPPPDYSRGYVWALYDSYDVYEANPDGSEPRPLISSPGYDAEATWCHRGGKLVFTSVRDGDLELYSMDETGNTQRLTHAPGYDGGAFYSPDCSEIVWRASRPEAEALEEYRALLAQGLIRPGELEIFVMRADGSGARQLTSNGRANFGPTFTADGRAIVYASNAGASPREFDLWMVPREGGKPERITTAEGFDGFPHFSPDGRYLVWASNRADPDSRQTHLFVARWIP